MFRTRNNWINDLPKEVRAIAKNLVSDKNRLFEVVKMSGGEGYIINNISRAQVASKSSTTGAIHIFMVPDFKLSTIKYDFNAGDSDKIVAYAAVSDIERDEAKKERLLRYLSTFAGQVQTAYGYDMTPELIESKRPTKSFERDSQIEVRESLGQGKEIVLDLEKINNEIENAPGSRFTVTAYYDGATFGAAINNEGATLLNVTLGKSAEKKSPERLKLMSSSICMAMSLGSMLSATGQKSDVKYCYFSDENFSQLNLPREFMQVK